MSNDPEVVRERFVQEFFRRLGRLPGGDGTLVVLHYATSSASSSVRRQRHFPQYHGVGDALFVDWVTVEEGASLLPDTPDPPVDFPDVYEGCIVLYRHGEPPAPRYPCE